MVAALHIGIGVMAPAHAGPVLTTPAGLAPGAHFRFVFVTDGTTDSFSSDITTYDSFVQGQADGATYNGVTVNWQAIGSTSSVNAIDHITGPSDDPVYLVTGPEVAANTTTTGLWSGTIMAPISIDINGSAISNNVWTGTDPNGDKDTAAPLGGAQVIGGLSTATDSGWIHSGNGSSAITLPMYGISQDLIVPGAIPEPSSTILLGTGLAAVLACVWQRQGRDRRGGPEVRPQDPPQ
jgi:hypothetical protein